MRQKRSLRQPGAVRAKDIRTASRFPNAGRSLAQRRRWYADEDTSTVEDDDGQPGADDSDDGGDAGQSGEDDPVPTNVEDLPEWAQTLIQNTRSEAATHRTRLREIEDARAEERRLEAEKKGEFKTLYEELKVQRDTELVELEGLREARTTRLEQLKERNEKRIGELAKDKQQAAREIIETAGTEDPDKVSAMLDKIIPTLGAGANPPPMDGGAKGDGRKQAGLSKVKLKRSGF